MNRKQPALFTSHGTIYEAFKSEQLKSDFQKLRQAHFRVLPDTIVLFSGHWQTEGIRVTTSTTMTQLDEGFPAEFQTDYSVPGNIKVAAQIIDLLNTSGIKASGEPHRNLDHGSLIPLLLLFPEGNIPVVQISQNHNLDPNYHSKMGEALRELRNENIMFIASGGLVHNTNRIVRFGGHDLTPDTWARKFDDYISAALSDDTDINYTQKLIDAYQNEFFEISHPTTEHFLPLVFASALGGKPSKIYEGFQWKNLSMSAFKFE